MIPMTRTGEEKSRAVLEGVENIDRYGYVKGDGRDGYQHGMSVESPVLDGDSGRRPG